MYKSFLIFILLSFISISSLSSQSKAEYEKHVYINAHGDTLQYRLLLPINHSDSIAYPLIIFLHGISGCGSDNEQQLQYCWDVFLRDSIRVQYPAIVVFPQASKSESWYTKGRDGVRKPLVLVNELVDDFFSEGRVDAKRLYVIGISNGGYGTFKMIEYWPNRYAAAIPICGGSDVNAAEKYAKNTAVWIFHGENDKSVLAELSREAYKVLQDEGCEVYYTEYPDVGHNSWDPAFKEPKIFSWLFSKSKSK